MAKRQSRGRQTILIQPIENQEDRYATFSKRRLGLYKKASELCVICGVDIGIIIFSPTNHPYSFFSPNMESVLDRYMNPNAQRSDYARLVDSHAYGRINEVSQRLNEVRLQHEAVTQQGIELDKIDATREKLWWEDMPVEEMDKEQVEELKALFGDILSRTNARIEQLINGASTSSSVLPENVPSQMHHSTAGGGEDAGPSNQGNIDP